MASPVAGIQLSSTRGFSPFEVRFYDLSTNDPTTWLWDFGDATSTDRNPKHIFNLNGYAPYHRFPVTLTAYNMDGTDSTSVYVSVYTEQKSEEQQAPRYTGKSPYITSLYGDITVSGIIDGDHSGFGPNQGPGCNSVLLNNFGYFARGYGATHAGLGSDIVDPGTIESTVESFVLSSGDIDDDSVELRGYPLSGADTTATFDGTAYYYPTDFNLIGNLFSWRGKTLESLLSVGDTLDINYTGDTHEIVPSSRPVYGNHEAPVSIGSGSTTTAGGSGIRLGAPNGTVHLNGIITMDGQDGTEVYETGGGSGGSIWVEAWNIDGTGILTAEGGSATTFIDIDVGTDYNIYTHGYFDQTTEGSEISIYTEGWWQGVVEPYQGGGAGGYIALRHERSNTFDGTMSVRGYDGAQDGIIYLYTQEPVLSEPFTGTVLNTKWWEIVQNSIVLNNNLLFDSTVDGDNPVIQSIFSISGQNIIVDIDNLPDSSAEPNFYSAYFFLYADFQNYAGIARKKDHYFGIYCYDGVPAQTAWATDRSDLTWRINKYDSTFSFQYYDDSTNPPVTFFQDTVPQLAEKRFKIRMGIDKPAVSDSTTHIIEYLRLSGTDATNEYVTLSGPILDATNVSLTIIKGTSQFLGTDFTTGAQQILWDTTNSGGSLSGLLAKGDVLRVQYTGDTSDSDISTTFDNFKVWEGIVYDAETREPIIYVDPVYGSDSSNGRQLYPLQNLFVATAWARRGGTVVLYDGTYNPTAVTRKDLTIRGANGARPLITSANVQDTTGSGWENRTLSFDGCQGRVHNLILADTTQAIYAHNTKNLQVYGCEIYGSTEGIVFDDYNETPLIRACSIHGVDTAVSIHYASNPVLYSDIIYDASTGVSFNDSRDAYISACTIDDCGTAVIYDNSSSGAVSSSSITNDTTGLQISTDSTPVYSLCNNFFNTTTLYSGRTPDETAHTLVLDPSYVDQTGRDYQLNSDSSNIDNGLGHFDDFYMDYNKRNRSYLLPLDIGAFEFYNRTHTDTDYYVAGRGDDYVYTGDQADPFRTLDAAMRVADSTVQIDGGHYDSYYLSLRSENIDINKLTIYDQQYPFAITYVTLTDADISHKYLTIPGFTFRDYTNVAVNPITGGSQNYGTDFTVGAPNAIIWDGYDLENQLVAGDTLRILSELYGKPLNTVTLHSHFSNLDLGNAIYVSPNGSDSTIVTGDGTYGWGNGTMDNPYLTIKKALSDSSSGDNIVVMPGAYDMFSGLQGRIIVPAADQTTSPYVWGQYFVQDLFGQRDFRNWNHVEYEPVLWDFTYSPDSTIRTGSGFLDVTYDGTNDARADSNFSWAGEFRAYATIRNSLDPVLWSIQSSDSSIIFQYNDGTYVSSVINDGTTHTCYGTVDVNAALQEQFMIEYITVNSDNTQNGWAPLSYLNEDCTNSALNVVGGVSQEYGTDYIFKGGRILWSGYGLDGELDPGDILRVMYLAQGLGDPIRIGLSVVDGIFEARAYNWQTWQTLMMRNLSSDATWNTSFYMDEVTYGESHECQRGRGFMSQLLVIADSFSGTNQVWDHLARTERKPIILYDETSLPWAPYLTSPANGAVDTTVSPTFYWSPVTNADSYRLQVSLGLDFTSTVVDQTGILVNYYTATGLVSDTTHYWRVDSSNADGTSPWSGIRYFITE